MAIAVGIVADGHVEAIPETDQPGHRIGRRAVHADPAVPVEWHEGECRIQFVVDHLDANPEPLRDRVPEREAGAAERIDADAKACTANDVGIDDRREIAHVRPDVVMCVRRPGVLRALVGDARHMVRRQTTTPRSRGARAIG